MVRTLCPLALLATGAAAANASDIAIILEIDATDTSAVVFTATGAVSNAIDNSVTSSAGVTLLDLFAGDVALGFVTPAAAGDLTANGAPAPFNRIANDFGSVRLRDLNLWNAGDPGLMDFNFAEAAFTGSWTIDLSSATFGQPGTVGFIVSGDTPDLSNATLGEWRLVPAPGGAAVLGLAGLAGFRRRR